MNLILQRIEDLYKKQEFRSNPRGSKQKLYLLIYEVIKNGIINLDLPHNSFLPSTRSLSEQLGVSRSTINKAYEILRLDGYVLSQPGAGHSIKSRDETLLKATQKAEQKHYPSLSETGKTYLSNVSLINSTDDKSVAFRPGLPPLDIFPVNQWKNLSNLYWRNINISGLSYSPSSGNEQLKVTIANYLNLSRNIKCDPRQIFIVSGSLQSLFLIGTVLLNPGDLVGIENPTFPNVHSIFRGLNATICPFELDKEGVVLNSNAQNIKLLHLTPSCHYPTGIKMSEQRKYSVLDWVNRNESLLIENDYEHELSTYKSEEKTLFELDQNQRTIYLSTFNRLLHPSLRIGFMVVPNFLINPIDALLKHSHRFVAPSIQIVLNQFIEKKYLHQHIKRMLQVTNERRTVFVEHFNHYFKGQLELNSSDTKSLQVLAHLPADVSDKKLVEYFAQHHLVVHSYSKCFIGEPKKQGIIMGYSSIQAPAIKRKIAYMHQLYLAFKL